MTSVPRTRPVSPVSPTLPATPPTSAWDLAVGFLLVLAVSFASCWLLALPTSRVLPPAGFYLGAAGLLWLNLSRERPGSAGVVSGRAVSGRVVSGRLVSGIGLANRLTLARLVLAIAIAALAVGSGPLSDRGYWWILGLSTAALTLDAVDGPIARRTRAQSAFGARFDMEVDAFLLLVLCVLLWQSGKTGAWVLLIGGLRYGFWLIGLVWPPLSEPLPPSLRRKTVCVVQGVALVIGLSPILSARVATGVAAGALLLLCYSFAVDTLWLVRSRSGRGRLGAQPGEGWPPSRADRTV